MSVNFLGLGFSFTAKDDGLAKMQKSALKGFESLNKSLKGFGGDAVKNLNKDLLKVQENLKNITQSLDEAGGGDGGGDDDDEGGDGKKGGKQSENWSKMRDTARNLGNAMKAVAGEGLNLTIGMEAQFKAIDVHAAKYGEQIHSSSKTIAESNAYARESIISLGLSAEKLVVDYQQWSLQQKAFAEMGIADEATFSKVTSVYELNSEKLQEAVTALSGPRLKVSGKLIGELFGQLQQAGEASHDTATAMQSFGKVADKVAEQRGLGKSAEDAVKFVKEGIQLTGMLGGMTNNFETASKASDFFSTGMYKSELGMRDLWAGMADDISDFAKATSNAVIPFEELQELNKTGGPAALFKKIFEVIQKAKASNDVKTVADATNFMMSQFSKAGGAEQDLQLLRAGLESATPEMMAFTDASFDSAKATDAFINKLTDAEKYTGVTGQFDAKFRQFGESAEKWVAKTTTAFDSYSNDLKKLEGDDKRSVERIAEINKFGLAAILPEKWMPVIHQTSKLSKNFEVFSDVLGDVPWVGGLIKPLTNFVALLVSIRPKLKAEMGAMTASLGDFFKSFGMESKAATDLAGWFMGKIDYWSKELTKIVTNPMEAMKDLKAWWDKASWGEVIGDSLALAMGGPIGLMLKNALEDFSAWGPSYMMTHVLPQFQDVFAEIQNAFTPSFMPGKKVSKIMTSEKAAMFEGFTKNIKGMSLEQATQSLVAMKDAGESLKGQAHTKENDETYALRVAQIAALEDLVKTLKENNAITAANTAATTKNITTGIMAGAFSGILRGIQPPTTTTAPPGSATGPDGVPMLSITR